MCWRTRQEWCLCLQHRMSFSSRNEGLDVVEEAGGMS